MAMPAVGCTTRPSRIGAASMQAFLSGRLPKNDIAKLQPMSNLNQFDRPNLSLVVQITQNGSNSARH